MKSKRHTTGQKIRTLREVDGGKPIRVLCQDKIISEATFHRWRMQFGLMEVNDAKRMKDLQRENSKLKKMLAESLLKNRVLEAVCEKSSERVGSDEETGENQHFEIRARNAFDVRLAFSVRLEMAFEQPLVRLLGTGWIQDVVALCSQSADESLEVVAIHTVEQQRHKADEHRMIGEPVDFSRLQKPPGSTDVDNLQPWRAIGSSRTLLRLSTPFLLARLPNAEALPI